MWKHLMGLWAYGEDAGHRGKGPEKETTVACGNSRRGARFRRAVAPQGKGAQPQVGLADGTILCDRSVCTTDGGLKVQTSPAVCLK